MRKTLVALLLAVLAVVGPAAAEEPTQDDAAGEEPASSDSQASEPTQEEPDEGSSSESASSQASSEPDGQTQQQASVQACRVVDTNLFDPATPMHGWVTVDPDGCVRHLVRDLLERPGLHLPRPVRFVVNQI